MNPRPGIAILRIMKFRGWMRADLAWIMGMDSGFLSRIIAGQRKISPLVAKRLSIATNTRATYWLMLQSKYDMDQIPRSVGDGISRRLNTVR